MEIYSFYGSFDEMRYFVQFWVFFELYISFLLKCKWFYCYQFHLASIFLSSSLLLLTEISVLSTLNMLTYTYDEGTQIKADIIKLWGCHPLALPYPCEAEPSCLVTCSLLYWMNKAEVDTKYILESDLQSS